MTTPHTQIWLSKSTSTDTVLQHYVPPQCHARSRERSTTWSTIIYSSGISKIPVQNIPESIQLNIHTTEPSPTFSNLLCTVHLKWTRVPNQTNAHITVNKQEVHNRNCRAQVSSIQRRVTERHSGHVIVNHAHFGE